MRLVFLGQILIFGKNANYDFESDRHSASHIKSFFDCRITALSGAIVAQGTGDFRANLLELYSENRLLAVNFSLQIYLHGGIIRKIFLTAETGCFNIAITCMIILMILFLV